MSIVTSASSQIPNQEMSSHYDIQAIFFIMTLWNFVMATKRRRRGGLNYRRVLRISPILVTFVWDGTVYYFT